MANDNVEHVSCPICGETEHKKLFKKEGLWTVKCRCGLVMTNPRLTAEALSDMYNENKISPKQYYEQTESEDKKTFHKRLSLIEQYAKKGDLLDLGCNIGAFMDVAKSRGWRVTGLDINKSAVEVCRKKGHTCKEGILKRSTFKDDAFDVVIMNDFIEHLPDPNAVLEIVHSIVKPGGVIFMATPDGDSRMFRMAKKNWVHLKPREHLWYFSRKTMRRLVEKNRFKLLNISSAGRYRNLGVILLKSKSYFPWLAPITSAMSKWKIFSKSVIWLDPKDEMMVFARK